MFSGCLLVQPYRGMGVDETYQEDSCIFVSSGYQTMCVSIAIYFLTGIIFLWKTPQISCLLCIDCYDLFRLNNHNSRIKASACVQHIASAAS